MCGEHEGKYEEDSDMPGSSPHVRGARNRDYCRRLDYGIIPACAGSTRGSTLSAPLARDHPRMCGEHAGQKFWFFTKQGSSPHVRGARALADAVGSCGGIIPACAGSTIRPSTRIFKPWDHPRMCGEHLVLDHPRAGRRGSSPHVRGALRLHEDGSASLGIIPACAGSTWRWSE